MTGEKEWELLIAEIERVLGQPGATSSELPAGEKEQISQLLERIRRYLVSLSSSSPEQTAADIAQSILTYLNPRLNDGLQSYQGELADLRQQKQQLLEEIQQLERQRQQLLTDFYPSDIWEQWRQLQQQGDRLVMSFDSTLRTVFETLEKDLQGYADSLSQGLERMHSLGQQGEAKFLAYFNRLNQQWQEMGHSQVKPPFAPTEEAETIEKISSLTDLLPPASELEQERLPSTPLTTLLIHAGENVTEVSLVALAGDAPGLTPHPGQLEPIPYGSCHLDRDIFCQLIYPQWVGQFPPSLPKLEAEFPQPGEPDRKRRQELELNLKSHPLGHSFLKTAKLAKHILQEQESFTAHLKNQAWSLHRQDLEEKILLPFWQKLYQEIVSSLQQRGQSEQTIQKIICSGDKTLIGWQILADWLRETFPQARLILVNS